MNKTVRQRFNILLYRKLPHLHIVVRKLENAANKMEEQRSLLCLNFCPSVLSDICNASEIDELDISDVDTT